MYFFRALRKNYYKFSNFPIFVETTFVTTIYRSSFRSSRFLFYWSWCCVRKNIFRFRIRVFRVLESCWFLTAGAISFNISFWFSAEILIISDLISFLRDVLISSNFSDCILGDLPDQLRSSWFEYFQLMSLQNFLILAQLRLFFSDCWWSFSKMKRWNWWIRQKKTFHSDKCVVNEAAVVLTKIYMSATTIYTFPASFVSRLKFLGIIKIGFVHLIS